METKVKQAVEGKEHRDTIMERVLRQRKQQQQRPVFFRAAVVIVGGVVSVPAAPLSVVAPELGLPLLLFGLRLLALEFDWAARVYVRVEKLARRVLGGLKRLLRSKRGIALVAVVVVALAAVAALVL